jgi:menaquinone-specific isochorismate synthase
MSWLPRLDDDDDDEFVATDALDFVDRALSEPLPPGKDILYVAMPAPLEAPEKFLRIAPRDSGFLWRSPNGAQMAGVGRTAELMGAGRRRFAQLRQSSATFWPRIHVRSATPETLIPAVVGGVAFVPGVPDVEPWSDFGTDGFTLAKWAYRRDRQTACMILCVTSEELAQPGAKKALGQEMHRLLVAMGTESATSLIEHVDISPRAAHHTSLGEWEAYIAEIKRALASGEFDKIVAARRCVIDLPKRLEDTAFMARLFAAYSDCTHFAISRGDSTFLGATPETLFLKTGQTVVTHALAGTIRVSDDLWADTSADASSLIKSMKTQVEHSLVAQKICDDLRPLARRIRYATSPQPRRVRHLIHLQTPISCELRNGVDAFDLISALHPTPAVGGFPTKRAASWLCANEGMERGWYTGTVGWIDAEGNAEFAVAIRCGVLTPRRAHIYAGAGIVKDSDAEAEYQETASKMAPLLRALGVQI